jgi:hypothetical protein
MYYIILFCNFLAFFKQFGGTKKVLESPYACVVLHGDRSSGEVYLFVCFLFVCTW